MDEDSADEVNKNNVACSAYLSNNYSNEIATRIHNAPFPVSLPATSSTSGRRWITIHEIYQQNEES